MFVILLEFPVIFVIDGGKSLIRVFVFEEDKSQEPAARKYYTIALYVMKIRSRVTMMANNNNMHDSEYFTWLCFENPKNFHQRSCQVLLSNNLKNSKTFEKKNFCHSSHLINT